MPIHNTTNQGHTLTYFLYSALFTLEYRKSAYVGIRIGESLMEQRAHSSVSPRFSGKPSRQQALEVAHK